MVLLLAGDIVLVHNAVECELRASPHCGRVHREKVKANKKTDCRLTNCLWGLTKMTSFIDQYFS